MKLILVSNSIHDGSSSIVAQLAAAQQNQQFHDSSRSISSNSPATRSNTSPQIHAAKLALASSSVVSSISANSNMSNAAVLTNSNNILSNGVMAASSNGNHIENQMLLRDYVNLPPPPPYPGTSSGSNLPVVSLVTNTAPTHGHSTSNISVGSNGMYKELNFLPKLINLSTVCYKTKTDCIFHLSYLKTIIIIAYKT